MFVLIAMLMISMIFFVEHREYFLMSREEKELERLILEENFYNEEGVRYG